jgi:uncharacterized membrane protein YeaQ/YmgE (transglycosylase-associated protein family)
MTMILGLVGATLGGLVSTQLFGSDLASASFDGKSIALSGMGAVLVLTAFLTLAPQHDALQKLPLRK